MDEERIMARGLRPPGPLLLVRKRLDAAFGRRLRVIVSSEEAVRDLLAFFEEMGVPTETDRAGDDYHVIADLSGRKKGD
ncbi:MAG: sulfurtransferase TusA family protein [Candidatus Krumholzibacteria bacterium]|nr:sulfurtransferase TusA family protein [Candidatus Krumholzibacteria bacterium]